MDRMFKEIFRVFSKREHPVASGSSKPLTQEFRYRVVMLLRDQMHSSFGEFLSELHRPVTYLLGKPKLSSAPGNTTADDDLLTFLQSCKDENFLDAIELIFRSNIAGITWPDNPLIPAINQFFQADDLPYHLTGYTTEETSEEVTRFGSHRSYRLAEYPRIIRKESEFLHTAAIEPALHLLSATAFKLANAEFLKALEDHRRGDFSDCLTKCGSAFESTMKIICEKNGIPFRQTDTASALLKAIVGKSNLDTFWEPLLMLIATLRNRLSSSHGAGSKPKIVPRHIATYAVNATASAIVLLASEFE
jgi:hypothetical protein